MPATQRKCIYGGLTLDVDRHYIGSVTATTHQEKGIITLESNPSRGTVLPAPHGKGNNPNKVLFDTITNNVGKVSINASRTREHVRYDALSASPKIFVVVVNTFDAKVSGCLIVPMGKDKAWIAYDGRKDTLFLYDREGNELR